MSHPDYAISTTGQGKVSSRPEIRKGVMVRYMQGWGGHLH